MSRCMQAWKEARGIGARENSSPQRSLDAPLSPALERAQATSRLERCFRSWRRLSAATKAHDLSCSVKLLNLQVARQRSSALRHWKVWAFANTGQRERRRFRVVLQRLALRRWFRFAASCTERGQFEDQASAVLRCQLLRNALQRWVFRSKQRIGRGLEAKAAIVALQKRDMRSSLSFLAKRSVTSVWFRQASVRMQMITQNLAKRSAVKTLHRHILKARHRSFAQDVASGNVEGRLLMSILRAWSQWCRRRLRRRSLLRGHLLGRVEPRCLRQLFQQWVSNVRKTQRHIATLERARIIMALSLKGRMFQSWLKRLQSTVQASSVLGSLATSLDTGLKASFLATWRKAAQRLQRQRKGFERFEAFCTKFIQSRIIARLRRLNLDLRRSEQNNVAATELKARRLQRQMFRLWHTATRSERHERTTTLNADRHRCRITSRSAFSRWKAEVATAHLEKRQLQVASHGRTNLLRRKAWSCWSSYFLAKRRRRRQAEPRIRSLKVAFEVSRRRRTFDALRRAFTLRQRSRDASRVVMSRALRSFQAWRRRARSEVELVNAVKALQQKRRGKQVFQNWTNLHTALHHRQRWEKIGVIAQVLAVWRRFTRTSLEVSGTRVAQGLFMLQRGLVGAAVVLWWEAVLQGRDLRTRAALLVEVVDSALVAHNRRQQNWALRQLSDHLASERIFEAVELCRVCLLAWHRSCIEQRHRRTLRILCEEAAKSRLLRCALNAWHNRLIHLAAVISSVVLWGANLATDRVRQILVSWRHLARRRPQLADATERVIARRQTNILGAWRLALLQRLAVAGVTTALLSTRRRNLLEAWQKEAQRRVQQRRADQAKTSVVLQQRQRSVLDRWSAARRMFRLVGVAEEWDGQVLRRQTLRNVFRGWSALMGLYSCGNAAAAKVGALRASRIVSHWSLLLRICGTRSKHSKRQAFAAWRIARRRGQEVRRGLARVAALGARSYFQQLVLYWRDRKRRKQLLVECKQKLQDSAVQRSRRSTIAWWDFCRKETTREQKLEVRHQEPDPIKDAERERKVLKLRRRGVLAAWCDAKLWLRGKAWHEKQRRLALEVAGVSATSDAFFAMQKYARNRTRAKNAAKQVSKLLEASLRRRFFHGWTESYEHESSSGLALEIMQRWTLSRIVAGWKKHANFRSRFAGHLAEVSDTRRKEVLTDLLQHWAAKIKRRRQFAVLCLDRHSSWSRSVLLAWRGTVQQIKTLRRSLQHMKVQAKFNKGSRGARQKRSAKHADLSTKVFAAYATWVKEVRDLRKRTVSLVASVAQMRAKRRLLGWLVHSRAQQHSLDSISSSYDAWAQQARQGAAIRRRSKLWAVERIARCRRTNLLFWQTQTVRRRGVYFQRTRKKARLVWRAFCIWRQRPLRGREATRRGQDHSRRSLATAMRAWVVRSAFARSLQHAANLLRSRGRTARSQKVALAWIRRGRQNAAVRRFAQCLSLAETRWTSEEEWALRAEADNGLKSMFVRFAEAFNQRRAGDRQKAPVLTRDGTFEALVKLIWLRQQLSVAFGRLRGYPQPWFLGYWPAGPLPLLSPGDPYYIQAQMRLSIMVRELEAEQKQPTGPPLLALLEGRDVKVAPPTWQRLLMWQALADLLVVHHPGWSSRDRLSPNQRRSPGSDWLPGGTFSPPWSPCFGVSSREVQSTRQPSGCEASTSRRCAQPAPAWVMPIDRIEPVAIPSSWKGAPTFGTSCGDAAGGNPITRDDAESDGTPSFGYAVSIGSADQAAGLMSAVFAA